MPTAQYGVSLAAGGVSLQRTVNRTGDGAIGSQVTLPVGKAISDWVKTDANTAAGNLAGGHGWSSGTYDFHWYESDVYKNRYGVTVTITTNAVAADGGSGDDFPASATSGIVMTPPVTINVLIDGDELEILGRLADATRDSSTADAHLLFEDSAGDDIAELDLAANEPRIYDIAGGATNPFTGDVIISCKASNGSSSEALTLKIVGVYDSTP